MAPANTDWTLPLDRRGASRYTVHFPVKLVDPGGAERLGICRNMSCTGGVLMTQNRLEVGERVEVSLYLSPDHSRATTIGAPAAAGAGPNSTWMTRARRERN